MNTKSNQRAKIVVALIAATTILVGTLIYQHRKTKAINSEAENSLRDVSLTLEQAILTERKANIAYTEIWDQLKADEQQALAPTILLGMLAKSHQKSRTLAAAHEYSTTANNIISTLLSKSQKETPMVSLAISIDRHRPHGEEHYESWPVISGETMAGLDKNRQTSLIHAINKCHKAEKIYNEQEARISQLSSTLSNLREELKQELREEVLIRSESLALLLEENKPIEQRNHIHTIRKINRFSDAGLDEVSFEKATKQTISKIIEREKGSENDGYSIYSFDHDNDGDLDAIVLFREYCCHGGNGSADYIFKINNDAGNAIPSPALRIGGRGGRQINWESPGVGWSGGILELNTHLWADGDALCCPSVKWKVSFTLKGDITETPGSSIIVEPFCASATENAAKRNRQGNQGNY